MINDSSIVRTLTIISSIVKTLTIIFPGMAGSAVAVYLNHRKSSLSFIEALFSWIAGWVIAYYLGLWAIEYWVIPPQSSTGVGIIFTAGTIGLNTVNEVLRQIPEWIKAAKDKWMK